MPKIEQFYSNRPPRFGKCDNWRTDADQMCGEFVAKPEFVYKHLGQIIFSQIKEGRKTVTLVWQELQDLLTKHWAKWCQAK